MGAKGRAGRTAGAVRFGLRRAGNELGQLALQQIVNLLGGKAPSKNVRVGGLRSGYAELALNSGRVTFHRFSEVPGVEVSGSFPDKPTPKRPARLRIGGRGAAKGRVTVSRGTARGRLGGSTVRFGLDLGLDASFGSGSKDMSAARALVHELR